VSDSVRVLYIDDDPGLGRLMQRALASKGLLIEHVTTAEDGIRRLAAGGIDVVALDHDLGHASGLDVLRKIRSQPDAPPVIYVTGSDDAHIAVAALKAGAADYVWKDVQGHYRDLLVGSIVAALAQERLKREKERAEREVREAKERADLLLREVNHRVANSLALVSALARLQANAVSDESAKLALQEMQARIAAVAGIHRRLYTSSDVSVVDMDAYLGNLVQELNDAMNAEAKSHLIKLDVETGMQVATDKAVSVGVVVTELVTNAYKYAYPEGVRGDIRAALHRVDADRLVLSVEDDGVGWSDDAKPKGTGVGTRIIKAMATNLKASLSYDESHKGTRVVMEFPV
jgi:two-component sensor histidine kinase